MRRLRFPDEREGRGAWGLAWMAVSAYQAGDRTQTASLRRLRAALRRTADVTIPDPTRPDDDLVRLHKGGADALLEEAEFHLLAKALDSFRKGLTGADSDQLGFLDDLLANAPEITSDEVEKLIGSLSRPGTREEPDGAH